MFIYWCDKNNAQLKFSSYMYLIFQSQLTRRNEKLRCAFATQYTHSFILNIIIPFIQFGCQSYLNLTEKLAEV